MSSYLNTISNWYGRLGNNIQQICNGIIFSQVNGDGFFSPPHDLIDQIYFNNFDKDQIRSSRFFYYKNFENENKDFNIDLNYLYKNIRNIALEYVRPNLKVPNLIPFDDETIVIHIRSGDLFEVIYEESSQNAPNGIYVPNPLKYYLTLIDMFDTVIVVTEKDSHNPIVEKLKEIPKVTIQSKTLEEDFATLISAKNLASSGVGTFCVSAALCNPNLKNFYCSDLMLTEHLNYNMIVDENVKLNVMKLDNYIQIGEWKNTKKQRDFILNYEP
jgi:hypothetical protein